MAAKGSTKKTETAKNAAKADKVELEAGESTADLSDPEKKAADANRGAADVPPVEAPDLMAEQYK